MTTRNEEAIKAKVDAWFVDDRAAGVEGLVVKVATTAYAPGHRGGLRSIPLG